MHKPGHIRQAFEDWGFAGRPEVATVEVRFEARQVPARKLLGMLWQCTDIIPGVLCSELDMEPGRTYAAAAQALRAS